jgi:diguanylate cyclase (GGDEF)-like protein
VELLRVIRRAAERQHPAVATLPVVALTTGAIYVLGAASVLLVVLLDPPPAHRGWLTVLPLVAMAAGAATLAIGRWFPRWAFHVLVLSGNLLVTAEIVLGRGTSVVGATMPLYVFVVLDAAFFFSLLGVGLHLAHLLLVTSAVLPQVGVPWQTVLTFNGVCVGVGVVVAAISRAADQAEEDPLTGLANRRGLDRRLQEAVDRARADGSRLFLVILDLDGFKEINDTHGHQRGDELLRLCSQRWRPLLPKHVVLGRYGGDEFLLVVPGGTLASAGRLADRLRAAVAPQVAASAGIAAWQPEDSVPMLVGRADEALYAAKAAGRDRTTAAGGAGLRRSGLRPSG